MTKTSVAFVALLVTACSSAERGTEASFDLQVTETSSELDLVGLKDGAELGKVHVQLGRFVLEDDGRAVEGRQMQIAVAGETVRHESEGYAALTLPLPPVNAPDEVNAFLLDPRVRAALARWQIAFDDTEPPATAQPVAQGDPERSYLTCSYATTPQCGATSCVQRLIYEKINAQCQTGSRQLVCCANTHVGAERKCGLGPSNPCGAEGPNGCAVCWTTPWTSSCLATVVGTSAITCSDFDGSFRANGDSLSLSLN
jgi:hypothetical protein